MKNFKFLSLFTLLLLAFVLSAQNPHIYKEDYVPDNSAKMGVDDELYVPDNFAIVEIDNKEYSGLDVSSLDDDLTVTGSYMYLSNDKQDLQVTYVSNPLDKEEISRESEVKEATLSTTPQVTSNDLPDPPYDDDKPDASKFSKWYYALYGVLVWLGGVLGKVFGLKEMIPKYVYVVIAFGIVIAGGFIWYGFDFMMLAITLASTLGIYDILAPLVKKKKTLEQVLLNDKVQ